MQFLLSTEGSLVITRTYQPYTLVGPPVRGLVLNPLAVYSSRTSIHIALFKLFLFVLGKLGMWGDFTVNKSRGHVTDCHCIGFYPTLSIHFGWFLGHLYLQYSSYDLNTRPKMSENKQKKTVLFCMVQPALIRKPEAAVCHQMEHSCGA